MLKCISFGNVFSNALLYEGRWDKACAFISLIGSESTVQGASATFNSKENLWFEEAEEKLRIVRHHRFEHYRTQTRKLAPHIMHSLIFPLGADDNIIIGRTQEEIKSRVLRKVQNQIPFMPEWREWLWQWITEEAPCYQSMQGHSILGGWLNINIQELKQAITDNMSHLKSLLEK